MARAEYHKDTDDIWLLRAYAWTLYDHVKQLVDAYEAKELSPTALNEPMTACMREFAGMAKPLRGDSTFSQMIRLAGKVSKDWHDFLAFAKWAGIHDFSADDQAFFVNDQGKRIDSLKTRFIRAICRETVARANPPQTDPGLIHWGETILEQALRDSPHDQWLNYYQSKLHLARGEPERAIKRLAPVLARQSGAAWTWALLGEILEGQRPDDAITCLAHATQLAHEEQEVAKVRIHLAHNLALAGRYDEAAKQAFLALRYREQHGFKVPQELQQLLASDWYRQSIDRQSLADIPPAKAAARALLQEIRKPSLGYTTGVVDHVNAEKGVTYIATGSATGFGLVHHRFPEAATLAPGTLVDVGRAGPEGQPEDFRLSNVTELRGLCQTFTGRLLRQEGKSFAFIRVSPEDIFVPPTLANGFAEGQTYSVTCLAIKRVNKQGKTGWRAVRLMNAKPESDHASDDLEAGAG